MPAGWVSAGVAVVGAAENIDANDKASSAAKKNNAAAQGLNQAQGTMLNDAESIANTPFTSYTGDLTAPMSGNQQGAYSLAAKSAAGGGAQDLSAKGVNQVDQVANNGWSDATAKKYMNPYTKQVTDNGIENMNRSYLQNLGALNEQKAGSGAFGGSRAAIQQATLASDNQRNIGDFTAKSNSDAYDSAIKTWQADNKTKLDASNAYQQAGEDVTKMNSSQVSDLLKTGGVSQVISQTNLANQYGQFMRQQNWAPDRLGSLIYSVGSAKGNGQVSAAPQSNTANQLLGLASTIGGLYGGASSGGGNTFDTSMSDGDLNAISSPNSFSINTSDIAPAR